MGVLILGFVLIVAGLLTIAKLAEQRGRRRRFTIRWASRPVHVKAFWH